MNLTGVCPSTVVVQQDWEPEAEHAAAYELIGQGYTIDADKKRVSGPLVIDGMDTGVKIEVRSGGGAIGFQSVPSQMYVDQSITLGAVTTDAAISASSTQPVTAVVAPLEKSPQMLMWDPATHPTWTGIADIGKSDVKVVVSSGTVYSTLLSDKGLVKAGQFDTSYDGAPARFVASPDLVQQGYATAEPYVYQHEVPSWNKPVKYQLLSDVGYNVYPEALSVRTADLAKLSPCLKKLVPILQKAQINYLANPGTANKLLVEAVEKFNDSWTYSEGVADYAAKALKDLGIVANDGSGALGGMDQNRVQSALDTLGPILKSSGAKVKDGLKASDLATNQFIDPSITLK
ncbi:ABC transporter substrate-binding protein [Amycolatopsis cynarae]|uniref:ABC transporter substrate-binding protein n=1 Tax=Amycolatopsis cynarae TaxID=2995223 RepID=A0ABY7AWL2_9PSEU|nr:ABC transporter substrate-binding protein [Amycolatopsis sp. HUAS 11-8]WAL64399.1 ABC transporter substrate-binding protein [Amycolatopsis sp. HUAS 11-8]